MSTPAEAAYYTARAAGGTGLVITGITFVADDFDPIAPGLARIDGDQYVPGLRAIADAVHEAGGLFSVQLTGGLGRNNQYCATLGMEPRSASDNTWFFDPSVISRPLEVAEIQLLVRRFGEAAARVKEAGADAIDIHGHTGYLIDQFMSACWNRRTDEYGGSVENRCRFVREIIAAIKSNAPGLPVSFRISVDHKFDGGRTWDETQYIVKELERAGIDLIIADDGSYEAMDYVFPPYYLGDDCMVTAAERIRAVVDVPVAACGNITPENGEKILARGGADMIGIGRGLIADPDIVNKLRAGRAASVRPCIRCNQLCTGNAFLGKPLGCAVNPEVGYEGKRILTTAADPKRVVIVGAGPAGLEAARVAGARGHDVRVYERENHIGGVLLPAATPDFKRELRKMIDWWDAELAELPGVEVKLGYEIRPDSAELQDADVVLVATGSHPLAPASIPGIEKAVEVIDGHTGAPLGKRVVVCGGGLSGADFALEIAEQGHEVTIVEMAEDIARDMFSINKVSLDRSLAEAGVRVLTGTRVTAITDSGVDADGPDGSVSLEADTVVAAFGVRPARELVEALTARDDVTDRVYAMGDCVDPRKVGDAINEGYELAYSI
ncbi:FAD-dependent oxidoreductase [Georgenia yuyongxinii]|uniref:oxidoreductase n=1 Tax=Georgenia yuyongxinii TaxID=2589797 RepID=UPI001E38EA1C|nr:FAD-dependent oxidoreductase [Georgenia yuyongxinii]